MIFEIDINVFSDRYSDTLKEYDQGVSIEQLSYYLRLQMYRENRDQEYYRNLTDQDIFNITKKFINLYLDIKERGYDESCFPFGYINKDGLIRLRGGYHRMSILRHLGYKSVKVDFEMHHEFEKFFGMLKEQYKNSDRAYHPILHPVCKYWTIVRGENRGELIQSALSDKNYSAKTKHQSSFRKQQRLKILDIGSFNGVIAHYLSLQGHEVIGIEPQPERVYCANYILNYLRLSCQLPGGSACQFIQNDIVSFFKSDDRKFDVIIMLSVDRWIKDKDDLDFVFKTIGQRCKYFFFESRGNYLTIALERIEQLTSFGKGEVIGTDDGETKRLIYLFNKDGD